MHTRTPVYATVRAHGPAGLFLALIIVLLALSVVDEAQFARDRIGVSLDDHPEGLQIAWVESGRAAERAGLQAGDIILVPGEHEEARLAALDQRVRTRSGESLVLNVLKEGQRQTLELVPGAAVDIGRLLAQLILVLAYTGLALLAARYRDEDQRARLLMLFVGLIAIELAMPVGLAMSDAWALGLMMFWLLSTGVQIGLELHLVSLIPARLPLIQRHPWIITFYYALGLLLGTVLAGVLLWQWHDPALELPALLVDAESYVMAGWAMAVSLILVRQVIAARSARARNQALLVLIGMIPWALYMLAAGFWPGWEQLGTTTSQVIENLALLAFPAAVFVAIFRFGLIEIENLVRRSLVYGVVAALVLILLYTLLTTALPWFTARLGDEPGLWLITALAVGIGVLFRPLRHQIELLVERGLFPERQALRQRLIEITGKLDGQGNPADLLARLARETREALGLRWVLILAIDDRSRQAQLAHSSGIEPEEVERLGRRLGPDSPVFATLARRQRPLSLRQLDKQHPRHADPLSAAGAEMLVPLTLQQRPLGLMCLSAKSGGELFAREEIELLDLFSCQIATRLDNLRLFQDATYDGLTGLLRREAILERLAIECELARAEQRPLCVAMIDLDHFKVINDSHGHLVGDRILEQVARAMRRRVRAIDAIGRFGGEEFLLIMPETDIVGGRANAEKLQRSIADPGFVPSDQLDPIGITASIGLSTLRLDDPAETPEALLERADQAVYRAKSEGRNRITDWHQAR